jgi:hypothetical protein
MSFFGIPTATENAVFSACCTISSGMTSQPALAVALALCAPSICRIPAPDMTRLASAASTKERYMFTLR